MSVQLSSGAILEYTNGAFFILSLYAGIIFGHYIWLNKEKGYLFVRPALPFFLLFASEAILRGPFWLTRHLINQGEHISVPDWFVAVDSTMICAAILCAIRVYSPNTGGRNWIVALNLCVVIILYSWFF